MLAQRTTFVYDSAIESAHYDRSPLFSDLGLKYIVLLFQVTLTSYSFLLTLFDKSAEEFVHRILNEQAHQEPSDSVPIEDLQTSLPPWYDEKKFKRGQEFFVEYFYAMITSTLIGLVAMFAIPSILKIMIASRRSSSALTAYRRYWSTVRHILSWFQYELKPGTISWKSLHEVRSRHIQAGRAASLKGLGTVSQRDVALSLYTVIGFTYLKPDKFGITQRKDGDWDALNHLWRVIAYMVGLQDRYNICSGSYDETREILQILQDRVFTPCLDNPPEYFEHMTRAMIYGVSAFYPSVEPTSFIFLTKNLADVPGYAYTEAERLALRHKLLKCSKENSSDKGVPSSALLEAPGVEGISANEQRLLYTSDYACLNMSPAYKQLSVGAKFRIAVFDILVSLYRTNVGRIIINIYTKSYIVLATYFPFIVFWKFGIQNAYSDMFKADPVDNTVPRPNSEFSKP